MSCRHQDNSPQLKSPRPLPRVRKIPDQDDHDRCQMTNWWLLRLFHWQHQSMPVSTWRVASDVGLSTGVNNPQPTTGVNSATLPSLATCHRKPNIRARVPAIDTSLFVRVARGRDAVQTAARHLQELLRQGWPLHQHGCLGRNS